MDMVMMVAVIMVMMSVFVAMFMHVRMVILMAVLMVMLMVVVMVMFMFVVMFMFMFVLMVMVVIVMMFMVMVVMMFMVMVVVMVMLTMVVIIMDFLHYWMSVCIIAFNRYYNVNLICTDSVLNGSAENHVIAFNIELIKLGNKFILIYSQIKQCAQSHISAYSRTAVKV